MVLKKMDALEFVKSLDGGWDCVIWDPPYLNRATHQLNTHGYIKKTEIKHRAVTNKYYNELVLASIKYKAKKEFVIIDFFNKLKFDSNDFFIWYKGSSGAITGNKISNNLEFINIYYNNYKINYKETEQIFRVLNIPFKANQFLYERIPYEKPVKLYQKLFKYLNPSYVIDSFAGSYNSVKACNNLGIEIDACDKYEKIPEFTNLNTWL